MSSFPGGVGRDWSGLLSDVLAHIAANRLTSIDYLTFRTVCRSWASAVKDVPPVRHVPYLLLGGGGGGEWSECFTFLSLPDGTFHRLPVPKLRGRYCIGYEYGWLATTDPSSDIYLLNPFTSQEIRLPSLTTLPEGYAIYAPHGYLLRFYKKSSCYLDHFSEFTPDEFHGIFVHRVVFSSLFSWPPRLIFTREREGKWIIYNDENYHDVIFHRGKLLGLETEGAVHAINLDGGSVEIEVIAESPSFLPAHFDKHLVVDASGGILGVWSDLDSNEEGPLFPELAKIYIAKLDGEERKWVPLKSLVGHSLFIGTTGSSILLSAKDVRGLKENCIYFTDTQWDVFFDGERVRRRSVGVYNLEDGTIEPCHAPDDRFNWPPPTWISPSLSRRAVL